MKKLRRKIAGYFSSRVMSQLLYWIIWLLHKTMRVSYIGSGVMPSFVKKEEGFIGIFWHGRMLMMSFIYPGRKLHLLISNHRDGEIIANIMKLFGLGVVRGSSSKGGVAALREMVSLLKQGGDLGITPDGPKGPLHVVKGGVAQLARLSGKAVIPISFSASRAIHLKSWDRFLFPLPFSRLVYVVGDPLYCRHGESLEEFRLRVETALQEVTSKADGFFI